VTEIYGFKIELDVNTEIYKMEKDVSYSLVLTRSLTADGSEDFDLFRHGAGGESGSKLDQYSYCMYGKIFEEKLSDDNKEK